MSPPSARRSWHPWLRGWTAHLCSRVDFSPSQVAPAGQLLHDWWPHPLRHLALKGMGPRPCKARSAVMFGCLCQLGSNLCHALVTLDSEVPAQSRQPDQMTWLLPLQARHSVCTCRLTLPCTGPPNRAHTTYTYTHNVAPAALSRKPAPNRVPCAALWAAPSVHRCTSSQQTTTATSFLHTCHAPHHPHLLLHTLHNANPPSPHQLPNATPTTPKHPFVRRRKAPPCTPACPHLGCEPASMRD